MVWEMQISSWFWRERSRSCSAGEESRRLAQRAVVERINFDLEIHWHVSPFFISVILSSANTRKTYLRQLDVMIIVERFEFTLSFVLSLHNRTSASRNVSDFVSQRFVPAQSHGALNHPQPGTGGGSESDRHLQRWAEHAGILEDQPAAPGAGVRRWRFYLNGVASDRLLFGELGQVEALSHRLEEASIRWLEIVFRCHQLIPGDKRFRRESRLIEK